MTVIPLILITTKDAYYCKTLTKQHRFFPDKQTNETVGRHFTQIYALLKFISKSLGQQ